MDKAPRDFTVFKEFLEEFYAFVVWVDTLGQV